MSKKLEYPENWSQIATTVKQRAGYRCSRCDRQCLPPTDSYRHLELSLRRALSALLGETHAEGTSARFHPQVHHLDGNPSHNHPTNLVCLCAGCHLRVHRHHPQPTPGQLSLKFKLPATRPFHHRKHRKRIQLTLEDLIKRLPRLPMTSVQQIELDL